MIGWILRALRPLWREFGIFYLRWALADMQRKNPCHPDMPEVITRLRDLRAERHSAAPSLLRRAIRWL